MSTTHAEPRAGLSGTTLCALLIAAAQAPLGSTMIAVALPSIAHGLSRDLAVVTSLLVTSYLVVSIVGQSPGGKLGDVLGHARTVRFGMFLQATGSCIGAVASSLSWLVLSRCLIALGGAFVVPATMALLRVHVAPDRRGRVFGLVGGTMGFSAAIGPPLGGELLELFGWRAIFLVSLPCLAVAALLTRISPLPSASTAPSAFDQFVRDFDWAGTALLGVGLAALVAASKVHGTERMIAFGFGAAVTVIFIVWELRARAPVLDPRLFRSREFAAGSAIIGLQNFAMYGLLFELPSFFERSRGASAREVGHALFTMMLAMFATAALGGRITDRFGSRTAALLGVVPNFTAMWLLHGIGDMQEPMDALAPLVLLGIGIGLTNAPAQTAAMLSVGSERSGMAAGATSTLRYFGGVCSVLMLGALLGGRDSVASLEAHLHAIDAFTVSMVLSALACALLPTKDKSAAA